MEKKQRSLRKKRALDELEGEEEAQGVSTEDVKLVQKQRQRKLGTDAAALAVADKAPAHVEEQGPLTGQQALQAAFKRERQQVVEEDDPQMKQYIEEQLAQRMGKQQGGGEDEGEQRPAPTDLDALLPETLRPRAVDTELGPSWVAGITEVPLTVEQKLKNIEETEAAKKRILQKSMALMTQGAAGVVEGDAGPGGARRGAFPVRFGRLNPEEEARIAANRAKKAEQREFHYKKRMEHKERNARAPAWL